MANFIFSAAQGIKSIQISKKNAATSEPHHCKNTSQCFQCCAESPQSPLCPSLSSLTILPVQFSLLRYKNAKIFLQKDKGLTLVLGLFWEWVGIGFNFLHYFYIQHQLITKYDWKGSNRGRHLRGGKGTEGGRVRASAWGGEWGRAGRAAGRGGVFKSKIENPCIIQIRFGIMECMLKGTNYLDLKFEDNADNYLINSLLGFGKNDSDLYIDELMAEHPHPSASLAPAPSPAHLIREVSQYLCLRTTPLLEVVEHIEQYNGVPREQRRELLLAVRREKLRAKREHAKSRQGVQVRVREEQAGWGEIKVEESQLSPFVFDDESQQTKKKKRNRMSAQNSRDRKKQYIRQIQNQNRQLRRRLALAERPRKMAASSRDFVKMLLCLGISCYNNLQHSEEHSPLTAAPEEYTDSGECEWRGGQGALWQQVPMLERQQQRTVREVVEWLEGGEEEGEEGRGRRANKSILL